MFMGKNLTIRLLMSGLLSFSMDATARLTNSQASKQAADIGRQLKEETTSEEDIHFSVGQRPSRLRLRSVEGGEQIKFVLHEIHIEGNTIFSTERLSAFWKSYLNKELSIADLNKISQMIAQHYREAGYVLAQALLPEQDIVPDKGRVTLQVLEGVLGGVRVEGGNASARKLVEDQLKDMPIGKPFNENELERRFLSIRKTPGLTIQPVFVPSKDKSGHTDLVFKIGGRRYLDGGITYNNTGNQYVGVHRTGLDLTAYNLVGRSKTQGNFMRSTRKDLLKVGHVRQTQLIGDAGARAYLEYTNVNARPRIPDVNKNSYKYANLMFMYPIIYKRDRNLRIRFALDGQNDGSTYDGSIIKNDHIRAGRLGLLYNFAGENDFWELATIFSHGYTGILGGRVTANPSRVGGKNNFRQVIARTSWAHKLKGPLSMYTTAGMQYTPDALLSTEAFGMGGSNYARGYDSTETTGDCGWGALTEMRLDTGISNKVVDYVQLYTSIGGGKVRNHLQPYDQFKNDSLLSFAVGIRGSLWKNFDYSLQAGKPLSRRASILHNKKWLYTGMIGLRFDLSKTWDQDVKAPEDLLETVDD
jgi:hemolysin activation/secretion protein